MSIDWERALLGRRSSDRMIRSEDLNTSKLSNEPVGYIFSDARNSDEPFDDDAVIEHKFGAPRFKDRLAQESRDTLEIDHSDLTHDLTRCY